MSNENKAQQKTKKTALEQLASDLLLGGAIGTVAKTLMAPVERVKLLMQLNKAHPDVVSGKIPPYKNSWECAKRVYAEQGVLAFWRGNLVNCLRYAPQQGSALAFNDLINKSFPVYNATTDFWKSCSVKLFSGGLAGAIANTICYPFDFARTRLASDVKSGKPQFKGIWDCISTTVRQQGIVGLYSGWLVTTYGAFVYRAGQLGLFKQIQDLNPYQKDQGTLGVVSSFLAVSLARTSILPFNYPFDTVRRSVMLESEIPVSQRVFKGSWDCFVKLSRQGVPTLYKGILPEIIRGTGGSLVVVIYDRLHEIYGW